MYTAQLTIERIQTLIKEKGLTQKSVLAECGINENTLKRMTDNKGISSFYLAKIADKLGCSVDYLLGRTDNSEENIIDNHNATITGSVQAIKSPVTVTANGSTDANDIMNQFMQTFSELSLENKVAALNFVLDMKRSA